MEYLRMAERDTGELKAEPKNDNCLFFISVAWDGVFLHGWDTGELKAGPKITNCLFLISVAWDGVFTHGWERYRRT